MIKMNFFILLLFLLQLIYIQSNQEEFRIVKLKDFSGENSYLPVKCGQKFIIEVDGNPTTGFIWTLENNAENEKEKLLTPLNLNERSSGEYYSNNKSSDEVELQRLGGGGIYHFKFQAHESKSGYTELNFYHKRPWTNDGSSKHKIVVKVVDFEENKKDL